MRRLYCSGGKNPIITIAAGTLFSACFPYFPRLISSTETAGISHQAEPPPPAPAAPHFRTATSSRPGGGRRRGDALRPPGRLGGGAGGEALSLPGEAAPAAGPGGSQLRAGKGFNCRSRKPRRGPARGRPGPEGSAFVGRGQPSPRCPPAPHPAPRAGCPLRPGQASPSGGPATAAPPAPGPHSLVVLQGALLREGPQGNAALAAGSAGLRGLEAEGQLRPQIPTAPAAFVAGSFGAAARRGLEAGEVLPVPRVSLRGRRRHRCHPQPETPGLRAPARGSRRCALPAPPAARDAA